MGTKTSATASVHQATTPGEIRNVVLVGHSGGGKTTLFEHLVAATTPGYRAKPILDERSVQLSVASFSHDGVVVNLIDTPGYPDFVGELRAGLRAAESEPRELIEGHRSDLIEAIIQESEDDTLLDRYLDGEDIDIGLIISDLLTAVSRGRFHPVIP